MKLSIVTISFNQKYDVDLAYIVVEPGSADDSRDIYTVTHFLLNPHELWERLARG